MPVIAAEVVPAEKYPPTPAIPEEVHDVWRAVVADLGGANNMRDSYLPALEAYCIAVYTHAQAAEGIRKLGVIVKSGGKTVINPAIKVQKDSAATMLRYAETLGLTPASRIRLGLMEITGMSLLGSLQQALDGGK